MRARWFGIVVVTGRGRVVWTESGAKAWGDYDEFGNPDGGSAAHSFKDADRALRWEDPVSFGYSGIVDDRVLALLVDRAMSGTCIYLSSPISFDDMAAHIRAAERALVPEHGEIIQVVHMDADEYEDLLHGKAS